MKRRFLSVNKMVLFGIPILLLLLGISIYSDYQSQIKKSQYLSRKNIDPKDWPGKMFSEARVYVYNCLKDTDQPIISGGSWGPQIANPDGIVLSPKQTEQMIKILNYTYNKAAKYGKLICQPMPHHAVVFFDDRHLPVAHASICIECAAVLDYPETNWSLHPDAYKAFVKLLRELKLPVWKKYDEYYLKFHPEDTVLKRKNKGI